MSTCAEYDEQIERAKAALATAVASGTDTDDMHDALDDLKIDRARAHKWKWVVDWMGDNTVYRGTLDLSGWRCRVCDRHGHGSRNDFPEDVGEVEA